MKYYLENEEKLDHNKWYMNTIVGNLFKEWYYINEFDIEINSKEQALENFKELLEPDTAKITPERNIYFIAICFYLDIKGYSIDALQGF